MTPDRRSVGIHLAPLLILLELQCLPSFTNGQPNMAKTYSMTAQWIGGSKFRDVTGRSLLVSDGCVTTKMSGSRIQLTPVVLFFLQTGQKRT